MKKIVVVLAMAMALPLTAWATVEAPPPCVDATLADYLEDGFSCTIEDKVFSDFSYNNVANPDSLEISAANVDVFVDATPLNPGLVFQSGWYASGAGQWSDIAIGFTVTVLPGGGAIEDASFSIPGSLATGNAFVIGGETLYLGCTGPCDTSTSLEVWNYAGTANDQLYAHTTFDPVMVVTVIKDILLVAGGEGDIRFTSSVSIITQNFSEVPEPATLTLLGTGLLAIGGKLRRMRKNAKSS